MDISVIIVSYNSADVVLLTLASLRRAMVDGPKVEVIVVDNMSTDGTSQRIQLHAPWVKLVEMESNAGFAKANNVGMKMATGNVMLILNPDTVVCHDTLSRIVEHFRTHKGSGAIGVRMVNGRGRYLGESKRGYTNLATSFFKLSGLWHFAPRSKVVNSYYMGGVGECDVAKAPILSGACMAFSHELYDRVGGFDEGYFMYCEDNDLSWRMNTDSKEGNIYRGDIPIVHFKGQSTPRKRKYIKCFHKSMQRFAEKYEFPKHGAIVNAITTLGIKVAYCFALVRCVIMRTIERQRKFSHPKNITIVTDDDEREIIRKLQDSGATVSCLPYTSLSEHIDSDAVVFSLTGNMAAAIEYMRANTGQQLFGFSNDMTHDVLIYHNNRLHNITAN